MSFIYMVTNKLENYISPNTNYKWLGSMKGCWPHPSLGSSSARVYISKFQYKHMNRIHPFIVNGVGMEEIGWIVVWIFTDFSQVPRPI